MDPATDAAIALAIVSVIEKLIADHNAAKSGTMTGDEVLTRVNGILSDLAAGEKANDVAADNIVDERFPK